MSAAKQVWRGNQYDWSPPTLFAYTTFSAAALCAMCSSHISLPSFPAFFFSLFSWTEPSEDVAETSRDRHQSWSFKDPCIYHASNYNRPYPLQDFVLFFGPLCTNLLICWVHTNGEISKELRKRV
jgi:hypothetical protein